MDKETSRLACSLHSSISMLLKQWLMNINSAVRSLSVLLASFAFLLGKQLSSTWRKKAGY